MSRIRSEELWQLPEIYQFAKEAVIPREDSEADPWQAAMDYNSYGVEGRMEGILTRMLSIARKQQRLPEFRAEVAAALPKRPDWLAGKALLAVIDIQMGAKEQGKKEWREVFDDPKADVSGLGALPVALPRAGVLCRSRGPCRQGHGRRHRRNVFAT